MQNEDRNKWIPGPGGFDLRNWVKALPRHGWTAEMIRQLPEQFRFEVINGELLLPEEIWNNP